ncbi:MAG: hypothetical protein KDK36_22390, partial [Leptospiraceae bacterium]|nr:hypothetical protein [Leptospiraceae bacterium]
ISLHEAGHAKDFSLSKYPTTMALSRILPFMSLYQEGTASEDAIVYLRKNCLIEEEEKAYRQLPPAYSTYLASSAGSNVIFFAIPGHMVSIDLRDKFKKTEIPECGKIFGKGYKKK